MLENQKWLDTEPPINFALIQIHGSPAAQVEDEKILNLARELSCKIVYLIHRPDEVLLNPTVQNYFEQNSDSKFIFLGDLIFRDPFWAERRHQSLVMPHPYLGLSLPLPGRKIVVGAFTSWGEMRDPEHYFDLVRSLNENVANQLPTQSNENLNLNLNLKSHSKNDDLFEFQMGGAGLEHRLIPPFIHVRQEPFVPHFNVQLYHLHGKKRYGESSGSLHRGISIPVIFEANGAERLEGFHAIKIVADDKLQAIDFDQAARDILNLAHHGLGDSLERNLTLARANHFGAFAQTVLDFLKNK